MSHFSGKLIVSVWLAVVGGTLVLVERYKSTPGEAASAPESWPRESRLTRAVDRPTLIMLIHPRCPCSRASITELAHLMDRVGDRLEAYVLFLRPSTTGSDWDNGTVWDNANAIRGVHVLRDEDGVEAARFGAKTSGQTLVYDASGRLAFRGGLTPERGHEASSGGRERIASLVLDSARTDSPVFGCALYESEARDSGGF